MSALDDIILSGNYSDSLDLGIHDPDESTSQIDVTLWSRFSNSFDLEFTPFGGYQTFKGVAQLDGPAPEVAPTPLQYGGGAFQFPGLATSLPSVTPLEFANTGGLERTDVVEVREAVASATGALEDAIFATKSKAWFFDTDAESWQFQDGGPGSTGQWQSGRLEIVIAGRNRKEVSAWRISGTWADLLNIAYPRAVERAIVDLTYSVQTVGSIPDDVIVRVRFGGGDHPSNYWSQVVYTNLDADLGDTGKKNTAWLEVPLAFRESSSSVWLEVELDADLANEDGVSATLFLEEISLHAQAFRSDIFTYTPAPATAQVAGIDPVTVFGTSVTPDPAPMVGGAQDPQVVEAFYYTPVPASLATDTALGQIVIALYYTPVQAEAALGSQVQTVVESLYYAPTFSSVAVTTLAPTVYTPQEFTPVFAPVSAAGSDPSVVEAFFYIPAHAPMVGDGEAPLVIEALYYTPVPAPSALATVTGIVSEAQYYTPAPAPAWATAQNPQVVESLYFTPAPANLSVTGSDPTLWAPQEFRGLLATTVVRTVPPALVLGFFWYNPFARAAVDTSGEFYTPQVFSPGPADIGVTIIVGAIIEAYYARPAEAASQVTVLDPTVLEAFYFTPAPAGMLASASAPLVVLGLYLIPVQASATLATQDPQVVEAFYYTPAPATARLAAQNPSVIESVYLLTSPAEATTASAVAAVHESVYVRPDHAPVVLTVGAVQYGDADVAVGTGAFQLEHTPGLVLPQEFQFRGVMQLPGLVVGHPPTAYLLQFGNRPAVERTDVVELNDGVAIVQPAILDPIFATKHYYWDFQAGPDGFVPVSANPPKDVLTWQNGRLEVLATGRNTKLTNHWRIQGTWADLVLMSYDRNVDYITAELDFGVLQWVTVDQATVRVRLRSGHPVHGLNVLLYEAQIQAGVVVHTNTNRIAIPEAYRNSGTSVILELETDLDLGNDDNAVLEYWLDNFGLYLEAFRSDLFEYTPYWANVTGDTLLERFEQEFFPATDGAVLVDAVADPTTFYIPQEIKPAPADARLTAADPVVLEGFSYTPEPASVQVTVQNPQVAAVFYYTPAPATASVQALDPAVSEALYLTPAPAEAAFTVQTPQVIEALYLELQVSLAVFAGVDPAVVEALYYEPSISSAILTVAAPTVITAFYYSPVPPTLGVQTVAPLVYTPQEFRGLVAPAVVTAVDPALEAGFYWHNPLARVATDTSISVLTPQEFRDISANVSVDAVDPGVVGAFYYTPVPADVQAAASDPNVITAFYYQPSISAAVLTATDPTVITAFYYTPASSDVAVTIASPVVSAAFYFTPASADVAVVVIFPEVIESLYIAPDFAAMYTQATVSVYTPQEFAGLVATALLTAIDPALVEGFFLHNPVARAVLTAADPDVFAPFALTPSFVAVTATGADPSVISAYYASPAPADAQAQATDPTVIEALYVANLIAEVALGAIDPQVVAAFYYTPAPASAVVAAQDPSVIAAFYFVTEPALVTLDVINPQVVTAFYYTPGSADSILIALDPSVIEALYITPIYSSFVTTASDPTVYTPQEFVGLLASVTVRTVDPALEAGFFWYNPVARVEVDGTVSVLTPQEFRPVFSAVAVEANLEAVIEAVYYTPTPVSISVDALLSAVVESLYLIVNPATAQVEAPNPQVLEAFYFTPASATGAVTTLDPLVWSAFYYTPVTTTVAVSAVDPQVVSAYYAFLSTADAAVSGTDPSVISAFYYTPAPADARVQAADPQVSEALYVTPASADTPVVGVDPTVVEALYYIAVPADLAVHIASATVYTPQEFRDRQATALVRTVDPQLEAGFFWYNPIARASVTASTTVYTPQEFRPTAAEITVTIVSPTVISAFYFTPVPADLLTSASDPQVVAAYYATPASADLRVTAVDPGVVEAVYITGLTSSVHTSVQNPQVIEAFYVIPDISAVSLTTLMPTVVAAFFWYADSAPIAVQIAHPTVVAAFYLSPVPAPVVAGALDPEVFVPVGLDIYPDPATGAVGAVDPRITGVVPLTTQVIWFDFSDRDTVFSDEAGTIPIQDNERISAARDKFNRMMVSNTGGDENRKPIWRNPATKRLGGAEWPMLSKAYLEGDQPDTRSRPYTFYIAVFVNTPFGEDQYNSGLFDSNSGLARHYIFRQNINQVPPRKHTWGMTAGGSGQQTLLMSDTEADMAWHILAGRFDGDNSELWLDGQLIASGDSGIGDGATRLIFGGHYVKVNHMFDGFFGELLAYDPPPTAQEHLDIMDYLWEKWVALEVAPAHLATVNPEVALTHPIDFATEPATAVLTALEPDIFTLPWGEVLYPEPATLEVAAADPSFDVSWNITPDPATLVVFGRDPHLKEGISLESGIGVLQLQHTPGVVVPQELSLRGRLQLPGLPAALTSQYSLQLPSLGMSAAPLEPLEVFPDPSDAVVDTPPIFVEYTPVSATLAAGATDPLFVTGVFVENPVAQITVTAQVEALYTPLDLYPVPLEVTVTVVLEDIFTPQDFSGVADLAVETYGGFFYEKLDLTPAEADMWAGAINPVATSEQVFYPVGAFQVLDCVDPFSYTPQVFVTEPAPIMGVTAGEFYTPQEFSALLAEVILAAYDPTAQEFLEIHNALAEALVDSTFIPLGIEGFGTAPVFAGMETDVSDPWVKIGGILLRYALETYATRLHTLDSPGRDAYVETQAVRLHRWKARLAQELKLTGKVSKQSALKLMADLDLAHDTYAMQELVQDLFGKHAYVTSDILRAHEVSSPSTKHFAESTRSSKIYESEVKL